MDPLIAALQDLRLQAKLNISATLRTYNVDRTTLGRHFKGAQASHAAKCQAQQLLTPQQERTLVGHIKRLTEAGLPPTPSMIRTFAGDICKQEPGERWTSRFIKR